MFGMPNFDANSRSHHHHFTAGFNGKKLPETFRDDDPTALCNGNSSEAAGEEPPKTLHIGKPRVQPSHLDFLSDQLHAGFPTRSPVLLAP